MKKRIQIFLAIFYLIGALWVPLHTHYCGNELTELSLFTGELDSDDCECTSFGNSDCCSDIVINAENNIQKICTKIIQLPERYFTFQVAISTLIPTTFHFHDFVLGSNSYFLKSPPFLGRTYIDLSVFRI